MPTNKSRRLAVRRRLEDYYYFALEAGRINRSDIMRIGEVSRPQASHDLKMLREDYPRLGLVYNASAKTYQVNTPPQQEPRT